MARSKINNVIKNPLLEAINKIKIASDGLEGKKKERKIVDIITFCDSPAYLNLPANNFHLYPVQRIILKTFYTGTKGNEDLKLTKEEWEWLYQHEKPEPKDGLIYDNNIADVIQKLLRREKKGFTFRELNLVLGRRGTKTILASVISAYEAYKLLIVGDGNPHKYYNLPEDDEIAIINVALSQTQSGRLFGHIQARLRNSPFFAGRIAKETTSEIRLYTDRDLEKKREGASSGMSVPGSILILCGHSNPDTLAGYNAILLLFDELAYYDESGKVTGKYFYDRLVPSLAKFFKYGDGRIVEISSPSAQNGIFYEIHKNSSDTKFDDILSYQLPTWDVNPEITYDHPDLVSSRMRNPDAFSVEFGAQWAKGGIFGNYFEADLITRCIRTDIGPHSRPLDYNYYLHIDPAQSGPRYVAVMVAKEFYTSQMGKKRTRIRLANVWVWQPEYGVGLLFSEIDKQILHICSIFRPMVVSYDAFNSVQSLELLRAHGVNAKQTSFNNAYKNRIYQNLKDLMSYQPQPELLLYDEPRLILEMKALKYRPLKHGMGLVTDKHGEVNTDDCADALAGACAQARDGLERTLPEIVLAYTPNWNQSAQNPYRQFK